MKNPCWKGYRVYGLKKKNGKRVPNCVPVKEELGRDNEWGRPELTQKMMAMTPGQMPVEMQTTQYHDTLNPAAWNGYTLKPDVRSALLKIADAFIATWQLPIIVKDIILTGSNANYNWTEFSDFDLHIIVEFSGNSNAEIIKALLQAKKELFNKTHNIKVKGYPVELYPQDSAEILVATGVYSLQQDRWLTQPMKTVPKYDHPSIEAKAQEFINIIAVAIASNDKEKLNQILQDISHIRKAGLAAAGEFSTENLVFKVLRNIGAIDKIRQTLMMLSDTELSLESYVLSFNEFVREELSEKVAAWQRKEGKNPEGGLNKKGVASYRKQNPGSKLQTAVTTEPSKLKKDSKSWKRRKSFCSRMKGMKKRLTTAKTANDPDSRINKSLRKWNC